MNAEGRGQGLRRHVLRESRDSREQAATRVSLARRGDVPGGARGLSTFHSSLAQATAMLHAQIVGFAQRRNLPQDALLELQGIVAQLERTSVLDTIPGGCPPVTLDGDPPTEETDEKTDDRTPAAGGDRYERLDLLGTGGMGEVWRVRDRDLNRTMAMKVIRSELMEGPAVLARFIEEAQCSAQLQHPGIVPVHELGRLPGGEFYFTMAEVRGRTLTDVIREVHGASRGDHWEPGPTGWTFRKLVDAFHRVCEAVAYAHSRGVVHRDLKPANVMLGDHGEVLVVDWGLAKVLGRRDLAAEAGELDTVVTDRSADASQATRMGAVAGTPAYMPPEQARGAIDQIDARSDVYALGAILWEILSGRPPYEGTSGMAVLQQVLAGPPLAPGRAVVGPTETFSFDLMPLPEAPTGPPLPGELVDACLVAMSRERDERFANAGALAIEVAAWLDGARRREQALEVVERAQTLGPEAERLRRRALALREEAAALLTGIKPWHPEADKAAGWAKEDEATELERQADRADLRAEQELVGSLRIDATLPEAHAELAERQLAAHIAAEAARDPDAVARAELALAEHATALPEEHLVRRRCAAYLKGDGALTLVTDPPGTEVLLHRYELHNRRLVPVFQRSLGLAPLTKVPLPMGSYLCLLRHPDRVETRYPVLIERQGHWDGVQPGATEPQPVHLPRPGELGPDDVYVAAGWFWSGGDPEAADSLPRRRLWCPELVVKRFPVTNREYIAFLDDLVATGREEDALRHAPRERAGKEGEEGGFIYGRRPDGTFELVADGDGDVWLPDNPVCMVDWWCVVAYAGWLAARTGQPWRLPGELEWEKAARGVDGRFFPWGDVLDPSWCCMRDSHSDRPVPVVVDRFPVDESPYGVRGMGGGMRDRCADVYDKVGPSILGDGVGPPELRDATDCARRPMRGGAYSNYARSSRVASRNGIEPRQVGSDFGFRVCRVPASEHIDP